MTRSFYTFAALPAISVSIYCQPSGNVVRQVPRVNDENLAGRYRDGGSALAQCSGCRTCSDTVHSHSGGPFLRQPSIVAVRFQQLPPTWCCATGRRRRRAAPRQQLHFAAAARGHLAFQVSGRMPRALRRNLALSASRSLRTARSGAAPIAKPEVKPSPRSPHAVRAQASHADGQLDTVARDSAGLRIWPAPHRLCETRHRWPAPRLGRHRRERFPGCFGLASPLARLAACHVRSNERRTTSRNVQRTARA